ncbi:MAG: tetratricopeptide repeat protein, partial [Anaerolineae bacterium]|nr:tetratricopeptide repeat protein [Anaerolineae bacterium]
DYSARTINGLASSYRSLSDYQAAKTWYSKGIDLYPDSYHLLNGRGLLAVNLDEPNEESDFFPFDWYQAAKDVNQFGSYAYLNQADRYESVGFDSQAETEYRRLIAINPYSPLAYAYAADFYANTWDDIDTALDYLNQALTLAPTNSDVHEQAALIYAYVAGDVEQAISHFESAIVYDPYNLSARDRAAIFYSRRGDYEIALSYLATVKRFEPFTARYYIYRAQIYFAMGNYTQALEDLEGYYAGEDSYQDTSWGQLMETFIYLQQGNYPVATDTLDDAFSLAPQWTLDWNQHRGLRIYDQRAIRAQEYYSAIINEPEVADNYLQLANVLVEFGGWNDALAYYRQYLSLVDDPGVQTFVDMLASHVE